MKNLLSHKYGSTIWSPLASSTIITRQQVTQNAALRTATGWTQTYNICMTKHSYFPYTSIYTTAPRITIQAENTTSITCLTQTYNILQHSKAKTLSLTMATYTTNFPTVTTTDIKQTCAIYIFYLFLFCCI